MAPSSCSLFLLLTYYTVVTEASVVEEHRKYSCCGGLQLQVDVAPWCDQIWNVGATGDEPFASYKNHVSEACQSPCQALSSGNITLDRCANASIAIVCTKEQDGVEVQERRIFFNAEVCTDQPEKTNPQRGHYVTLVVVLLLVLVMMAGIIHRRRTAGLPA